MFANSTLDKNCVIIMSNTTILIVAYKSTHPALSDLTARNKGKRITAQVEKIATTAKTMNKILVKRELGNTKEILILGDGMYIHNTELNKTSERKILAENKKPFTDKEYCNYVEWNGIELLNMLNLGTYITYQDVLLTHFKALAGLILSNHTDRHMVLRRDDVYALDGHFQTLYKFDMNELYELIKTNKSELFTPYKPNQVYQAITKHSISDFFVDARSIIFILASKGEILKLKNSEVKRVVDIHHKKDKITRGYRCMVSYKNILTKNNSIIVSYCCKRDNNWFIVYMLVSYSLRVRHRLYIPSGDKDREIQELDNGILNMKSFARGRFNYIVAVYENMFIDVLVDTGKRLVNIISKLKVMQGRRTDINACCVVNGKVEAKLFLGGDSNELFEVVLKGC